MSGPSTPGITGYRSLTDEDKEAMNAVKSIENLVGVTCQRIREIPGVDQRMVSRSISELQVGFMLLVRAIAQPVSELRAYSPE